MVRAIKVYGELPELLGPMARVRAAGAAALGPGQQSRTRLEI